MPCLTRQEVLDAVSAAILLAEPKAVANEIELVERDFAELAYFAKVIVRLDDDPEVVSDALIDGLRLLSARADNGIVCDGTKMDWGRDGQDFVLLLFTVNMMKSCGG